MKLVQGTRVREQDYILIQIEWDGCSQTSCGCLTGAKPLATNWMHLSWCDWELCTQEFQH